VKAMEPWAFWSLQGRAQLRDSAQLLEGVAALLHSRCPRPSEIVEFSPELLTQAWPVGKGEERHFEVYQSFG
jgi:hypothetical protein